MVLIIGLIILVALNIVQSMSLKSPFRRVAVSVSPAVVNIAANRLVRSGQGNTNELDEFLQREPQAKPSFRYQHMLGTGFIFHRQGYCLTNYHVISGYEDIVIRLADGTEFPAESISLVGVDPWSDIAVLRIITSRKL
ncbi:MAG: trypsin-like peptidase domain-containing protein, partial [candidate division WOR-3 bacterium]